jgi:hypothetical protein
VALLSIKPCIGLSAFAGALATVAAKAKAKAATDFLVKTTNEFLIWLLGLPEPVPVLPLVPRVEPAGNAIHMVDIAHGGLRSFVWREDASAETPPDLIAHLFAEFFAAGRTFVFADSVPVEDVEVFQDRMTVACHGEDAKQFACRPARTCDFPTAYGVGAAAGRKATQFRHVGSGQGFADRFTQIGAKLL